MGEGMAGRFFKLLEEGAQMLGVDICQDMILAFKRHMQLMLEWNTRMNLTSITEEREIIIKHFLDSLSIVPLLPAGKIKMADVGTGAGFPGIPSKIARPDIRLTLIDSVRKKTDFLSEIISVLGMEAADAIHSRAEDLGADTEYRERFDVCTARAVAPLNILLEYTLPLVKKGGRALMMKGRDTGEIRGAKKALVLLGGEISSVKTFNLPFSDIKRSIIIVKKFRQTPTEYPRKAGKPSKLPLK